MFLRGQGERENLFQKIENNPPLDFRVRIPADFTRQRGVQRCLVNEQIKAA